MLHHLRTQHAVAPASIRRVVIKNRPTRWQAAAATAGVGRGAGGGAVPGGTPRRGGGAGGGWGSPPAAVVGQNCRQQSGRGRVGGGRGGGGCRKGSVSSVRRPLWPKAPLAAVGVATQQGMRRGDALFEIRNGWEEKGQVESGPHSCRGPDRGGAPPPTPPAPSPSGRHLALRDEDGRPTATLAGGHKVGAAPPAAHARGPREWCAGCTAGA